MTFLLPLAVKSLLIAGATLLLLKLMQRRSASDRSWIAHLGLIALLLLPVGSLALPALEVAGPVFLISETSEPVLADRSAPASSIVAPDVLPSGSSSFEHAAPVSALPAEWGLWAYLLPAAFFLLLTLVAMLRLVTLKARANVLVDTHWLKALALAQRRMGFKNGTALLISDELGSPISWGLMRPVILLNTDATKARGEAEAIIAHELAHIARLDWAKLMLARVTTALFWFNPLVWLLAREAHQLREEAADDAVLEADIEDTDYANLLVGIARHESRGLLLGAHGVAPGRNSLARRVKRVLDVALERAPGGWRWSSAAAFFAAGMVVPVAALQFVGPAEAEASASVSPPASSYPSRSFLEPARETAEAAAMTDDRKAAESVAATTFEVETHDEDVRVAKIALNPNVDVKVDVDPRPSIEIDPETGTTWLEANGARIAFQAKARARRLERSAIDRAVELKALGAGREYIAAIRKAAPQFRSIRHEDLAAFKALGVSPEYVAAIRGAGPEFHDIDADDLVAFKAVGITPEDIRRFRRAGRGTPSIDQMVKMKALGLDPDDLHPNDGS